MTFGQTRRQFATHQLSGGSFLRIAGTILTLACFVFLMEETMHHVGFFNDGQAIWWPTNGLALALLLRTRRRQWAVILCGAVLGSLTGQIRYGYPASANLVNAVANSAGPLIGAFALPRFHSLREWIQEPHLVSRFVGFALMMGPAVSATLYASYLHFFRMDHPFWKILESRGVSDMLGYAMLTPLVLVLSDRDSYRSSNRYRMLTKISLVFLVSLVGFVVFGQSAFPVLFVLLSVTLIASMQIGFTASVICVNLLGVIGTVETMHGRGPLMMGQGSILEYRILLLQAFLTLTMVTTFSIGAMQIEREAFQAKLKLAYDEMEALATIDALTGVGNRRLFDDFLETEWARLLRSGESIAVLMMDVDHFKRYNDDFGHLAGDTCLRAVAQAISRTAHRSTDLLARYGGEEFVFLLPSTTLEGAVYIAQSIRPAVENLYLHPEAKLRRKVTVSIGCAAMIPAADLTPAMLIGASDEALYRAKMNGRNCVDYANRIAMTR
jgi:diguanylate cyclase (GGDEF)-like protein